MKPIINIKTVEEITGYEATDGTKFNTKEECEKYEGTAYGVIKTRFREMLIAETAMNKVTQDGSIPFTECGEDCSVGVIRLNNQDDLRNANMFMELQHSSKRFTEDMIGKNILLYLGCCGDDWTVIYGTVDECVDKYMKGLMRLFDKEGDKTDA